MFLGDTRKGAELFCSLPPGASLSSRGVGSWVLGDAASAGGRGRVCPTCRLTFITTSSPFCPLPQPATVKTHNIIERTANFVCQQGAQFEIVLKAKQAGNSQFDFLRFDHYLNPYYKHVLRAMKEGRYKLASEGQQQPPQGEWGGAPTARVWARDLTGVFHPCRRLPVR